MRFTFERKVSVHPEPVVELNEGSVYFFVNFVDDQLTIPTMEPVVFVGRNLEHGDAGRVYFQDICSYREGVRYDNVDEEHPAEFQTGSETELGHVFEYEQALDVLISCAIRRREKSP